MKLDINRIKSGVSSVISRIRSSVERGFTAVEPRRYNRHWKVPSGTADELVLEDLPELRDKAQSLYRNTAVARGIVGNKTENAIGTGLWLQSSIDREVLGLSQEQVEELQNTIERKFDQWASSRECDAGRRLNFYQQQDLAFRNHQIDGECFALLPRFSRRGERVKIKVQLLPASRCESPLVANSNNHRDGIEFSDRGEPMFYYFTRTEGYMIKSFDYVKVPAFGAKSGRPNVLHIFKPEFIGQSRGIPFVASIIENLKNIDRFSKNELTNAVVSSLFTAFIKSNRSGAIDSALDGTDGFTEQSDVDYTLEAGAVHRLEDGEEITFASPNRPNSGFKDFMEQMLMEIGMAVSLPYEVLVKRFNSSFTASKAARIEAWRFYLNERTSFVRLFCDPIYREWFADAVYAGEIDAPGFFEDPDVREAYLGHTWHGEDQGQIDPVKETQAAIMKIEAGLSSRTAEAAVIGNDFDVNIRSLRRENRMIREVSQGMQMTLFPQNEENEDGNDTAA